jgi:hypothetical protein
MARPLQENGLYGSVQTGHTKSSAAFISLDKHSDTDKFIELVRARRVVWDINSDDYANRRTLKKEVWNKLIHLMINDFDGF